jgi:NAD(P)-dependent dehydrogenase (short-subunit alcohol dehydrogenase family)
VRALVEQTLAAFGTVDIAVNNAGTNPHFGPLLEATESMWDKTFQVNVKGYYWVAQAVAPIMLERGSGKIINIASVAGLRPGAGMGVYSVSKAAVLMLTQALAQELAPLGVRVNAIAPGDQDQFWHGAGSNERLVKRSSARLAGWASPTAWPARRCSGVERPTISTARCWSSTVAWRSQGRLVRFSRGWELGWELGITMRNDAFHAGTRLMLH